MAISDRDTKLLWGRAAGRCSEPSCHQDLTPLLEKTGDLVLGEMAHVIGRKPSAARGIAGAASDDTYGNLILLCPTHHTMVDKAEADFPVELLRQWKADWESQVAKIGEIADRPELLREINSLLAINHRVFSEWGPKSLRAKMYPTNQRAASIWHARRLGIIVPNNKRIISLLKANSTMLTMSEWKLCTQFIEHAEFFELHCIDAAEAAAYLPFPKGFGKFVQQEVERGQRQ